MVCVEDVLQTTSFNNYILFELQLILPNYIINLKLLPVYNLPAYLVASLIQLLELIYVFVNVFNKSFCDIVIGLVACNA